MTDETTVVRMRAEFDQAIREWDRLTGAAQRSATAQAQAAAKVKRVGSDVDSTSASLGRGGAAWLKYGAVAAGAIAGIGIKEVVQSAVTLEATFSKTMAQVAVQTKAPADGLKRLDDLALKLGADTVFSASDAASAMLSLAKGGLSVAQIEAGALSDTLTLAAAGEMELGQAADVVVQAMGAFQLRADQTDTAVAALAGGANASSASLQDMSMALSQTGTSANASGLSIQETTAYLALFADQGFKGSDAGTSLRTMLTRLVPQTKEAQQAMDALGLSYVDGNGKLVDATEIAARTQKAFKGLSDAERVRAVNTFFGMDAQRAVNAITVSGEAGLRKYLKSTNDLTQAQKLAEAANSGTAGALENLSGAAETALIKLGRGLAPTVQEVAGDISDLLESGDIEAWGAAAGETISNLVDELSPLASDLVEIGQDALPAVGTALDTTAAGFQLVLGVVEPVVDLFSKLPDSAQQALLLAGAATVIGGRMQSAGTRVMDYTRSVERAEAKSMALRGGIGLVGVGLSTLGSEMDSSSADVEGFLQVLGGAATGFAAAGPWGMAIGGAAGLVAVFGKSHENVVPEIDALTDSLNEQTGAITENSKAMITKALRDNDAFKKGREVGIDQGTIVDAALGEEKALKRIREARRQAREEYNKAVLEGNAGIREDMLDDQDFDKLLEILGDQNDALNDARRSWQDEADAKRQSIELNKISEDQIQGVRKALHDQGIAAREVPDEVVTKFTTPGYEKAEQNAVDVARKYKLTPKEVKTVLRALDYSSEQIQRVLDAMKRTDGQTATVAIRLDENNTTGQLLGIGRTIRNLDGSTATVYTRHVQKGNPNTGSRQIGGGTTAEADGGVLSFYAEGGMNAKREHHVAQIAPAGAWRVWAEPETEGEAYIPLASSKRGRSMEIWRETGRRLGATDVDFYRNGGVRSADSWEDMDQRRASRLELARMEQRIIQLNRDLNKRGKERLQGKDRQVARLELAEAKRDLRLAKEANATQAALARRRSSLRQEAEKAREREQAAQDAKEQAPQDAESTSYANEITRRARAAGLNSQETANAVAAQQAFLEANRQLRSTKKGTLEYKIAQTEVAKARAEVNAVLTRADQKKEELDKANEAAQQVADSFRSNGNISRWSSAGAASRSTDRAIADMGEFILLMTQLRDAGAPGWLLQQLDEHGPSRESIRVAKQYLANPDLIRQANRQAAQLQALGGAYGALTTNSSYWPGMTISAAGQASAGTQRLEVEVKTSDPTAIAREAARLVQHGLSTMMGGAGIG